MSSDEGLVPDRVERVFWKFTKVSLVALLIILGIGLPVFFLTCFYHVGVGSAVLLIDPIAKTVSEPVLGPTFGTKAPWVSVAGIYYATDSFEDTIPCFSSDQLEMQVEVLIRWSLDPTRIRDLYHSYPHLNYKDKAIESIMEETIRLVTKNFTALQTIEYRDLVVDIIESTVFKEIREEPSLVGALIHLEMDVKNIGYPEKYTSAIEDKLVAEQQKIQAGFERERILILANATAQELVIESEGEAEAKMIVANGTKNAIELILSATGGNSTNSTRIAELYLWVETLRQIAPEIDLFLMTTGEDGVPILVPLQSAD